MTADATPTEPESSSATPVDAQRERSHNSPRRTSVRTEDSLSLWPFGVLTAIAAVPVVWILVGFTFWLAHRWADWPTAATAGGLIYLAAVVGLIPLLLLVLDTLARRRGALTTKWFSIDFSKGVESEARPAVEIDTSLGFEGQPINSSSVISVHQTLAAARANEVVRVDLGTGESWWITRLFALCVGASRSGAPEVLLFVGRDAGVDAAFLGWVRSRDALRLLRLQRDHLRIAHDRAEAIARYITTVAPGVLPAPAPPGPAGDPPLAPFYTPAAAYANPSFQTLGEEAALRILLDLLGKYENLQQQRGGVERVTVGVLQDAFDGALRRDKIDVTWPKERQLEEFLTITEDYVAITDRRRFNRMVHRRALENALLRQLLEPRGPAV